MTEERLSRFVSKGFEGVTVTKAEGGERTPLLKGRLARISAADAPASGTAKGDVTREVLVSLVAAQTGLRKQEANKAVQAVLATITDALKEGNQVRLPGFGTFSVSKREAMLGRNPRTGAPMRIRASSQPKFKAGKGLRDAVN